jgi:high-affinity K+ transport system ATPase subunit B
LRKIQAERLRKDDLFIVSAGEVIPADGEIIEGILLQISGENGVFRLDLREGESDAMIRSLKKS